MANTPRPELSSVFDDMLEQNKGRFDDLYRHRRAGASGTAAATSHRDGGITGPSATTAHSIQLASDSAAVRRLRDRFGNDWRYEIAEQQRDGDEAIVLCKLTFGKAGSVRTQFGRAQISQGAVAGASSGVQFKTGRAGAEGDEDEAFRRATEAALMNCVDLI